MTDPLRPLFISSIRMWGGGEVWLLDAMRGLGRRGHRATLVCQPGGVLEDRARAAGLDVCPLSLRPDFDPLAVWRLRRLMRRRAVDVVLTNQDKELRLGGAAARLAGPIAVVPSREVDYPLKNRIHYRYAYNRLAYHILANSQATKRSLLRNAPWLDAQRIEVIHKGIDPAPYLARPEEGLALRRELGIAPDAPVVGFVGQLIGRKGLPDLVASMPRVAARVPGVRYLFAGEGKLADFLRHRTRELGVAGNAIITGFRRDVPAIMKAVDLLALPSEVEGFGYVLIEAMAAAKPVVGTRASSIPEIVDHGGTGLLVDVHRPDQLADAIVALLRDPARARALGGQGRRVMLEKFTLERMLDRLEASLLRQRERKRGGERSPLTAAARSGPAAPGPRPAA